VHPSPIPFIQEHRGYTSTRKYPKTEISIDFIPSSRTENEIFDQRLIAKRLDFKKELIFRDLINKLQAEKQYDFILFDVSPSASTLTRLALLLSDWVIINSRLSKHETKFSIDETIECLEEFSESIGRKINILGIQFNAFRKNVPTEYNRYIQSKYLYQETIFTPIPLSMIVSEIEGETVFEKTSAIELIDIYLANSTQILKKINQEE